ncbi:MAG: hypothetical protein FJX80_04895 [Bacteroidetes bacterium]|nr:hypothetical protein [Bacteroidota bacterium]
MKKSDKNDEKIPKEVPYTYSSNDIWLVADISALLGVGLSTSQQELIVWNSDPVDKVRDFEITLDLEERSLGIYFDDTLNDGLDKKTTLALHGIAGIRKLRTYEYSVENGEIST